MSDNPIYRARRMVGTNLRFACLAGLQLIGTVSIISNPSSVDGLVFLFCGFFPVQTLLSLKQLVRSLDAREPHDYAGERSSDIAMLIFMAIVGMYLIWKYILPNV